MNPVKIYRSGLVRRYHQNPEMSQFGQNNAAHQWGCAMLLLILHPDPPMNLLVFTLTHDVGEIDAGDLANPTKNRNPELTEMLRQFEETSRHETLGSLDMTDHQCNHNSEKWLYLVDKLEAVLFTITHHPQLVKSRGWSGQIDMCCTLADELECGEPCRQLIEGCSL